MEKHINAAFEESKAEFKTKFCREGQYMGSEGEKVGLVTHITDAKEYFLFIEELQAKIVNLIRKHDSSRR